MGLIETARTVSLMAVLTATSCARPEDVSSQTQVPTRSPERATTALVTQDEKPREGFKIFRSLHFPYLMEYPQNWTAESTQFGGKKIDIFRGEMIDGFQVNVNVLSEPVNSWVATEDYAQNYASQVEQFAPSGKSGVAIIGRDQLKDVNENQLSYGDKIIFNIIKTDVAKNRTYIVNAFLNNPLGLDQSVRTLTAIFVANGQGWQITFSASTKIGNERAILDPLDKFQKMLDSFKFRR